MEENDLPHVPGALPLGNNPSTNYIGGQVDPSVGMDMVEKQKIFAFPGIKPTVHLVV
jgi:hypothetical protein